jgi:hypothetical protein
MKVKEGVILNGLKIEMRKVLVLAEKLWMDNGHELVITAGLDGVHSAGSLHPFGYALDFRINYFDIETIKRIDEKMKNELGEDYDVVLHSTHIHVEYQKILNS